MAYRWRSLVIRTSYGLSLLTSRLAAVALLLGGLCVACSNEPPTSAPSASDGESHVWNLVLHDLPAALLSVSGASPMDVWTVGALLDDTALVLHYDGEAWKRVEVKSEYDLWWVHVLDSRALYVAGAGGTILRGDGESFEAVATPDDTSTLYGIWGASADDLWAVGTDGTNGVIWRSNAGSFEPADVDEALLAGITLFKVWGRAADDVWMVGDQGRILHFDGEQLTAVESGTPLALITVSGTDTELFAVGGLNGPLILSREGDQWLDRTPKDPPAFINGVYARDAAAYAVGAVGEVFRRTARGAFERVETGLDLAREYHAVWIDDEAGVWAVGGHVSDAPLVQGLLSYAGPHPPSQRAPAL